MLIVKSIHGATGPILHGSALFLLAAFVDSEQAAAGIDLAMKAVVRTPVRESHLRRRRVGHGQLRFIKIVESDCDGEILQQAALGDSVKHRVAIVSKSVHHWSY